MFSRQQLLDYIQNQEETDISYVKVGNGGQHLIVSFGHNGHTGFAQKNESCRFNAYTK